MSLEMRSSPQGNPADEVFLATVQQMMQTGDSMLTLAQRIVEEYCRRVPVAARTIQFKLDGDPFHAVKMNAQKLERYMKREVNSRMPFELGFAWIEALDEPFRSQCRRKVHALDGLLVIPMPESQVLPDLQTFSRSIAEFGEMCKEMSPVMSDGRIDEGDAPHVDRALSCVDALMGDLIALKRRLAQVKAAATIHTGESDAGLHGRRAGIRRGSK